MRWRRTKQAEQGETLLELVVAISILGVCVVAIAAGFAMSVRISAIHREQASAGAYARDYAEFLDTAVAGGGYQPCATTATYPAYSTPDTSQAGFTASIVKVSYWTTSGWAAGGCTVSNDLGLQQVTLQVASPKTSEQLVVVLRKP